MSKVYAKNGGNRKPQLKNKEKADINNDGQLSKYEKKRGIAIEKAMAKRSG